MALLVAGALLGFSLSLGKAVVAGLDARQADPAALPLEESRLLAEVLDRVRREYVEPVSDRDLIENALRGMLTELDAHSRFLTSSEYEDVKISTSGNYSGVGLEVELVDGQVTVAAALEGSAARRAGVRTGDVLIAIDGVPVSGDDIGETVNRMRGRAGSHVSITVARPGEDERLAFNLERRELQLHSVQGELLPDAYAYLRISQFSETTARDVRERVADLRTTAGGRLEGAVLDLRGNPGGLLGAAVEVADLFLDRGIIVTASGRTPGTSFRHDASRGDILDGRKLAVLVDSGSASAAEIVAGALKDHGRALVIGQRTYGKGSVQTVMPLADGRAMKLTTSRYFMPSGVSIQDRGVQPDVELGSELMTSAPRRALPAAARLLEDPPVREAIAALHRPERISHSQLY